MITSDRVAELLDEWRRICDRTGFPWTDREAGIFVSHALGLPEQASLIPQAVLDQMRDAHAITVASHERLMAMVNKGVIEAPSDAELEEIIRFEVGGGEADARLADLAADRQGLGVGGAVGGSPNSEPLADRIRAELAKIEAEIDPATTHRRAHHWLAGAHHVLRRITAVLDKQ